MIRRADDKTLRNVNQVKSSHINRIYMKKYSHIILIKRSITETCILVTLSSSGNCMNFEGKQTLAAVEQL